MLNTRESSQNRHQNCKAVRGDFLVIMHEGCENRSDLVDETIV